MPALPFAAAKSKNSKEVLTHVDLRQWKLPAAAGAQEGVFAPSAVPAQGRG